MKKTSGGWCECEVCSDKNSKCIMRRTNGELIPENLLSQGFQREIDFDRLLQKSTCFDKRPVDFTVIALARAPPPTMSGGQEPPAMRVGLKLKQGNTQSGRIVSVQATKKQTARMFFIANSLAHTKRVCKYHIIFTPKYRRKIIYH